MVDIQRVRELAELMGEHELSELRIREGETSINLRKGPVVTAGPVAPAAAAQAPPAEAEAQTPEPVEHAEPEDELVPIPSPMVLLQFRGTTLLPLDRRMISRFLTKLSSSMPEGERYCLAFSMLICITVTQWEHEGFCSCWMVSHRYATWVYHCSG